MATGISVGLGVALGSFWAGVAVGAGVGVTLMVMVKQRQQADNSPLEMVAEQGDTSNV